MLNNTKRKVTVLTVLPVPEMGFAEYNYFVETPEHDVLYFNDKKEARQFIEFYKQYQEKKNAKVNHSITVS
jgi:hypothetical protein